MNRLSWLHSIKILRFFGAILLELPYENVALQVLRRRPRQLSLFIAKSDPVRAFAPMHMSLYAQSGHSATHFRCNIQSRSHIAVSGLDISMRNHAGQT
jgi:hypothetical protein